MVRNKTQADRRDSARSIERKSVGDSLRSTSPVHVHVDNETPVHFHVQTTRKNSKQLLENDHAIPKNGVPKARKQRFNSLTNAQKTTKTKSPEKKRSGDMSIGSKVSWESQTHRLEAHAPKDDVRIRDMNKEDEQEIQKNMKDYRDKIDTLMDELGNLKNEVDLQKSLRQMERDSDANCGDNAKSTVEEVKLQQEKDNIENRLKHCLKGIETQADQSCNNEKDKIAQERDYLQQQVGDLQRDGKMAARHIYELQDVIKQLQQENISNSAINQRGAENRGDLFEKLSEFEKTNKSLREMLQEQHQQEMDQERQREQVEVLLLKISEYESRCQRLSLETLEKDRSINELQGHVQGQLAENAKMSSAIKSLESVKGHLQRELKQKEGDVNRLTVQVRALEGTVQELKTEKETNARLLDKINQEIEEKEGLKKACKVYKQKAETIEEEKDTVAARINELEMLLSDSETQLNHAKQRIAKLEGTNDNSGMKTETLTKYISDLELNFKNAQLQAQKQAQDFIAQLDAKNCQIASMQTEAEQIKVEVETLRASVTQYETLVAEYKAEMQRTRQEAELTVAQLEHEQLHSSKVHTDNAVELQQLKDRLQMRLRELEPLPALLEQAETKLQSANARLTAYEQRNHENTNLIAELTAKLEVQTDELVTTADKSRSTADHNRSLLNQNEAIERKITEMDGRNRDLTLLLSQRDQSIASANSKLEDVTRESKSLARQLENTQADLRRQSDSYREKSMSKERTNQIKLNDLEHELTLLKSETIRLKREKDEAEHMFNTRNADVTDRLEQSYATNRSMQNYVCFLKQSYGNVFGDVLATEAGACHPVHP